MFVVLDAAAGGEMVGTDHAVVGEDNAARCHAEVCGVIGYGAAHTANQTTCRRTPDNRSERGRRSQSLQEAVAVSSGYL